jgi:hypothetical protein
MKLTLNLPGFEVIPPEYWPGGDDEHDPGLCAGCGAERYGQMAKLHPVGWLHAEDEDGKTTCLQKAIDALAAPDMTTAWTTIARHVAKYPSRHDAATIRTVLRELVRHIESKRGEQDTRKGATTPELVVYRASHDSIAMGLYTTAAAARAHCETAVRREHADSSTVQLWWREDEDTVDQPEDCEQELIENVKSDAVPGPGYTRPTGYVVTPLTVASAYDEEADE